MPPSQGGDADSISVGPSIICFLSSVVERLYDTEEVISSILIGSTIYD
jgi:hypothetical protein